MKVKIKINKELQKLRVFAFITKDFALNKNFFSCIEGCTCSESYSVESIRENLEKNKFPFMYICINKLLDEKYLVRENFYRNLALYKFDELKYRNSLYNGYVTLENDEEALYHLNIVTDLKTKFNAMHEMEHFSSFRMDGDSIYFGFSKSKRTVVNHNVYEEYLFGEGVNEGFTDFLTTLHIYDGACCIQKDDFVVSVGYPICYQYIKCLTGIIGLDVMKKWYYEGKADELFHEIVKYSNYDGALQFYEYMDYFRAVDTKEIKVTNSHLNKNALLCSKFLRQLSVNKYGEDVTGKDNIKCINRKNVPKQIEEECKRLCLVNQKQKKIVKI